MTDLLTHPVGLGATSFRSSSSLSMASPADRPVATFMPPESFTVRYDGAHAPSWLPCAVARLQMLLRLEKNWDSYDATPVAVAAAVTALRVLGVVMTPNTQDPFIAPVADGGLQVEWSDQYGDVGFFVGPEGEAQAYHSQADEHEWSLVSAAGAAQLAALLRPMHR